MSTSGTHPTGGPQSGPEVGSAARRTTLLVVGSVLALVLAACGSSGNDSDADQAAAEPTPTATTTDSTHVGHSTQAAPVRHKPLRKGESRITVKMPEDYTPSAPTGTGTDDYRCFLLDPKSRADQFITGFNVLPGNPDVVHHVILFRVPADLVPEAEQKDASTPGQGWTCFGSSGIGKGAGVEIDDAPWLGAWAPGGSEQVYGKGLGEELGKGSRVIMQVHYNLLAGQEPRPQRHRAAGRTRRPTDITALQTQLLPAPVELPCRPRAQRRPAVRPGRGRSPTSRSASATARARRPTCSTSSAARSRRDRCSPAPGRSCSRRRSAGSPDTCTCWVARSRSRPTREPPGRGRSWTSPSGTSTTRAASRSSRRSCEAGDTVKVTCRHTQKLRDDLPVVRGPARQVRRVGRGHHRRDVPRDPARHPARRDSVTPPAREMAGEPAGPLP